MKFRLTIANQGLLLITIPLICEIIFVAFLWTALGYIDEQRKEIARSREFVAQVIDLTKDFLDAGICLGAWKTTRSDEFSKQYDAIVAGVPQIYHKLTDLSANDPQREKHVDALKKNGRQILELISGFRKPTGIAMLVLMDPAVYKQKLRDAYQGFFAETGAIAREEQERQSLNPAVEERERDFLSYVLLGGVAMNVVVTLWMASFFSQRVTRRLTVLTDNCRKFVERKELNKAVGGHDEIADLDSHIHEMVDTVRSAERKRDEYVQMVNHDLRSPLAAIQAVLANTAKGLYGELSDKGKSRIADAKEDAVRLVDLINETMETDRLESGQFKLNKEEVDLSGLVANVVSSLRPLAEQKTIGITVAASELQVNLDRARMHRVLVNLIDNAIKYAPNDSKIEVSVTSSANRALVQISDAGAGVKPGEEERIFEPYDRGTNPGALEKPGKGLGLSVCKVIVEAHGGSIGVKGRDGKGSTFWLTLPSA
ncbi:MAG TPA: ATP-binding protein [Planktothrix sp.]